MKKTVTVYARRVVLGPFKSKMVSTLNFISVFRCVTLHALFINRSIKAEGRQVAHSNKESSNQGQPSHSEIGTPVTALHLEQHVQMWKGRCLAAENDIENLHGTNRDADLTLRVL
ncbi:hypothetical protein FRC03_000754 [Tulasnella sp. 419]|nr:hypothetical protein FRC03_000754 [Tulasnella sp. 419]